MSGTSRELKRYSEEEIKRFSEKKKKLFDFFGCIEKNEHTSNFSEVKKAFKILLENPDLVRYKALNKTPCKQILDADGTKEDEKNKAYKKLNMLYRDFKKKLSAKSPKPIDFLTELPKFIEENRDFKFNKKNKKQIKNINDHIEYFYEHPEPYIPGSERMGFEQLQYEIAKVRAQIKAYQEFLELQDPTKQKTKIQERILDLQDKKSKATSKEDEDYYADEIETYQRLEILTKRKRDLVPYYFLTQPQWAFERAHLKLEQDEREIKTIIEALKKKIESSSDPEKKKLQLGMKFYEDLIQYFNTEKSKGHWPTYDGFIASQAPMIQLSSKDLESYRKAQKERILVFDSLSPKPSEPSDLVVKKLICSVSNYQHKPLVEDLQKSKEFRLFMNVMQKNRIKFPNEEYELFHLLNQYHINDKSPSIEGFFTSKYFKDQSRHKTFRNMLEKIPEGTDEDWELIDKFKDVSQQYERLTLVKSTDEKSLATIQQQLEDNLKTETDKEQKKFIKEQIAFFKAFQKYIEDEKKLGKQASYDGFLISQAPTLSLTKEKMDEYREQQKEKIDKVKTQLALTSGSEKFLENIKIAYEGFPQPVLGPENPTHYDPQIAPVYRKYLESFVEDSKTLDELKFKADDTSCVIQDLPTTSSFDIIGPDSEPPDFEKKRIEARLVAITEKSTRNEQNDWKREIKVEIDELDQAIIDQNKAITEATQNLEKLQTLWTQFQDPAHDPKIEDELKSLGLPSLTFEDFEKINKTKKETIQNLKVERQEHQNKRSQLNAKLNEFERLMELSVSKTSSKVSDTLYSSASNPIQSVKYDFEGVTSTIENKALDTAPVCFRAPAASDYATITYQNGAQLHFGQDGKIYIPNIPEDFKSIQDKLVKTEEEFVTQLLEKFERDSERNSLTTIEIRGITDYNPDYSEDTKARLLKQMVIRYCYDSNGQWNNKKFMNLKFALTEGGSVTDDEIARNPKFSFLQSRTTFQLYIRDPLRRDTAVQTILTKKRHDELFKQENPDSPTTHSPAYSALKERNAKQQHQSSVKNFFKRRWNALWSSSDDGKKADEYLQRMVDASKKDLDAVFEQKEPFTPEQEKIQKAKDFLEKFLGIKKTKLILEIEKIRKDTKPMPKTGP